MILSFIFFIFQSLCFSLTFDIYMHFNFLASYFLFIYFNWRIITLQYCKVCTVLPYIDMNQPWVHMYPPILKPPLSPPYHSVLSQNSSFEYPASCIELVLAIYFTYGNMHVSMPFSQITPPSPFPTESKSLFFTSVSLLLSNIQGYH